jgi:Fe-S-cluster containining protein
VSERKRRALAILRDVDAALETWTCDASTECCRFALTGREPWVTQVEWRLMVDESARQGRRVPRIPADNDARCPFLAPIEGQGRHEGGRCTIYAARPLGCRTFFCERASNADGARGPPSTATREMRDAARALDVLTATGDRGAADDGKARPLRSWLRSRCIAKCDAP